jgi:hypothetical protein
MPARGTKRIVLDGKERYLPEDEVALGDLIHEGIVAQAVYEEAKARLLGIKERIVEVAKDRRNPGTASVTLRGALGGEARIVWARETIIDTPSVQDLEPKLSPELFKQVFERGVIYRLAKGYHRLVGRALPPELEKHRARIAAAVSFRDKAPSVKFFDS